MESNECCWWAGRGEEYPALFNGMLSCTMRFLQCTGRTASSLGVSKQATSRALDCDPFVGTWCSFRLGWQLAESHHAARGLS